MQVGQLASHMANRVCSTSIVKVLYTKHHSECYYVVLGFGLMVCATCICNYQGILRVTAGGPRLSDEH